MKVIINFGEKKVVVPCGIDGDISIRELINIATAKYSKLSYPNGTILNSEQVQLRLNNGAVVDPDDRVCDVVDDREELFAIIDSHQVNYPSHTTTINSNGELSSSVTSSNLSSSLSEHDRLIIPNSNNRHEVIVTDADLRTRSLRVKNDPNSNSQQTILQHNKMTTHRPTTYSPPTHDGNRYSSSSDDIHPGMYNVTIDNKTGDKIFSILLPKENSPLGIHVVPYNNDEEQVNGLVLQNIEADGRIKRQGILQINDRIIEINRTNIERCSFEKAQLIFRTALIEPELELKIVRREINPNNDLSFIDHDANMNSLNTRRLGKIIKISLVKGNDGLGFKLASRDNPTGLANPIYVKTIFPKGAAIEDGRLQRGDRLLSVNSVDVTQMSLQETVALLRETRAGDTVELCISRQRDGTIPNDLISDGMENPSNDNIQAQIMTFDIPLNDTSSAGLGITLKGKTSIVDGQSIDLGIFVKSILTGGAASRDNRLRPNDQLLVINDSALINLSNLEAAAILHEAVRREIHPGHIKVTISRLPVTTNVEQQRNSTRYVKETDLLPPLSASLMPVNNDENELDLTTFVPPLITRKPPSQQSNRQYPNKNEQQTPDEIDSGSVNPFERETPFRQSISEKRRLTHQPNKQILQWKQRSFHEGRTQQERKSYPMSTTSSIEILTPVIDISDDDDDDDNDIHETDDECRYSVTRRTEQPIRVFPDSSSSNNNRSPPNLIRSSSFESIHITNEGRKSPNVLPVNDEERKRQAKLRSRACNDSFRQAVDKSYGQNIEDDDINEKFNKSDKQRFRFSNLFNQKSKRKESQEESKTIKSIIIQPSLETRPTYYPPPPPQFTSTSSSTTKISHSNTYPYSSPTKDHHQQGYQPYRFDSPHQIPSSHTDHLSSAHYESHLVHNYQNKNLSGKSSLSINHQKPSHPSIPRQFLQTNMNGSQSLRQHQTSSHPTILPPPPPPSSSIRPSYPSTFTVQPNNFTSYSHNFDNTIQQQQQTRRIGYTAAPPYPPSRNYFHLESPANV